MSNCFADQIGGNRTFSAASMTASDLTNESCESYCSARGFAYSGTEYSTECFCSNKAPSIASNACTMPCSKASANEICGGPNALSVSYNNTVGVQNAANSIITTPYTSRGCYSDNYPSRVLTGAVTSSTSTTVENCILFCNTAGYTIAGVENGNECFCGNTLLTDGSTYGVKAQSCGLKCAGNNDETCGGPNALNIYAAVLTTSGPSTVEIPFTALYARGACLR